MRTLVALILVVVSLPSFSQYDVYTRLENTPATKLDIALSRLSSVANSLTINAISSGKKVSAGFLPTEGKKILFSITSKETPIAEMKKDNCEKKLKSLSENFTPAYLAIIALPHFDKTSRREAESLFKYQATIIAKNNEDLQITCNL